MLPGRVDEQELMCVLLLVHPHLETRLAEGTCSRSLPEQPKSYLGPRSFPSTTYRTTQPSRIFFEWHWASLPSLCGLSSHALTVAVSTLPDGERRVSQGAASGNRA